MYQFCLGLDVNQPGNKSLHYDSRVKKMLPYKLQMVTHLLRDVPFDMVEWKFFEKKKNKQTNKNTSPAVEA